MIITSMDGLKMLQRTWDSGKNCVMLDHWWYNIRSNIKMTLFFNMRWSEHTFKPFFKLSHSKHILPVPRYLNEELSQIPHSPVWPGCSIVWALISGIESDKFLAVWPDNMIDEIFTCLSWPPARHIGQSRVTVKLISCIENKIHFWGRFAPSDK